MIVYPVSRPRTMELDLRFPYIFMAYCLIQGSANFLGIAPKYICEQWYYPLDLKMRKNELIPFKIVACAMIINLAY
jgi:hypothetical protein